MLCWKWRVHGVGMVLAVLSLAGCPQTPQLFVTPLAANFGATGTATTFRIINAGGGTLTWQVTESIPWLTLVEKSTGKQGPLSGETTNEVDVIEMLVNRAILNPGNNNGTVSITSNGGDQTVAVAVTSSVTAQIQVTPTLLELGAVQTSAQFTITNLGAESLNWSLSVSELAPWLSATPNQGLLSTQGASATVTVTANRASLAPGAFQGLVSIVSNGGDEQVTVIAEVPTLVLQPASIALGTIGASTSRIVTLQNRSFDAIAWTATPATTGGGAWLAVAPLAGNLPGNTIQQVTVTANPIGLSPGDYTGEVTIAAPGAAFSQSIPISISVSGFVISRASIPFGVIEAEISDTFTITNTGSGAIAWQILIPAEAAPWLSISPASGNLVGTDTITVTANPLAVSPGEYEADLSVVHGDVTGTVRVTMTRPLPPTLVAAPTDIDFSTTETELPLAIWNPGTGSVGWSIDAAGFPAWLSLSPANPQGVASGSVSGNETDLLELAVDRDQAPPDQVEFVHEFVVEATSGATDDVTVTVRMAIALVPDIFVEAEDSDGFGVPFVSLDYTETSDTFKISNTGNGPLFWDISGFESVPWITAIAPSQGTLDPHTQVVVTVSIDRTTLNYLGDQKPGIINSNDPDTPAYPLLIEVQVPKTVSIGVRPNQLSFGVDVIADIVEVANLGDPDTILNFQVASNKDWLNFFPDNGKSVGIAGTIKDWQAISVSVDRSLIEGNGASAQLTVTAFEIVDGQRVPLQNVVPIKVDVSVQALELTIESTKPRIRVPSLVRNVLMMRNIRQQALPVSATSLDDVASRFAIFEKGELLEISESNQFLTSSERIRANVLLILDYSGSMLIAARKAVEQAIATAPDPIQALYEASIPALIDELPAQYRVGIAIMSERVGDPNELNSLRLLGGDDGEPVFTSNKTTLKDRLLALDVNDNGATTLLPSLREAADILLTEDTDLNLIPFDDADMRAIIAVTDGRLTTSSNFNVLDTAQYLLDRKVRYMPIGWGDQISGDPLIRISALSGGHYYATRNMPTGAVDAFGNAIRIPVAATLREWCETLPGSPCDQSVAKDLKAQVMLSYVTLKNEPSITVEGRLTFNDPNDQSSPCLEEQGEITGSFAHTQLDFKGVAGDPRLGQISLRSEGLQPDETATLVARLEYAPRNITRISLSFEVQSLEPFAVNIVKVAESAGGVISNWNLTGVFPTVTIESPDGLPLQYGDFGDMFELRFSNVTQPFLVRPAVLQPVLNTGDPESKYFTLPDSFPVDVSDYFSPAFPTPLFAANPNLQTLDDGSFFIDLGTDADLAEIFVFNGGGSHSPTGVYLGWELSIDEGAGVIDIDQDDFEGVVISTLTPDEVNVAPDRTLDPGHYRAVLEFDFTYGSLGITFTGKPIAIEFDVTNPVLAVNPLTLGFGTTITDLPLSVVNTGQSLLRWSINTALLPSWLVALESGGVLGPDMESTFNIRVQRNLAIGPGIYSHLLTVQSENGQSQEVTVTMTVP